MTEKAMDADSPGPEEPRNDASASSQPESSDAPPDPARSESSDAPPDPARPESSDAPPDTARSESSNPPPDPSQPESSDAPPDPAHWATRVRDFVDEATRIAREDLVDKEVTFEDTTKRAEELIRKQPLTAVGLAAGVGLLAGILINRRR